MLMTNEVFSSASSKRRVLVVDDEIINRELLKLILEDEYDILTATDGEEALTKIRACADELSLILLDLLMPGMHGFEVIKTLKSDEALRSIPIIVLTADAKAEVESLRLGAVDFIAKPYPEREVILARVKRTIELSENTDIIRSTERDGLTGLYNRDYFYRYCRQFDQSDRDVAMDAIVMDVHRFRMINERYGKACGDDVLKRVAGKVRAMVRQCGGIVCRREADTFLIYCPHQINYQAMLETASEGLSVEGEGGSRVRLRMGVYANVDKSIDLERRFDRAKMAADTIRNNYLNSYALYDNALHESEIYAERLLEDFQDAIAQRQFVVYYQPKFDIRPETPVLSSAEALVRWVHPELGFISPGRFIPLFEENGLIQQLDLYVWRETAAQIARWKEQLGICVPVSVNVSRIDMYDPNLIETFQALLERYDLTSDELLLEITESAYTQDSAQIISKVNHLRDLGFHIEMDDFGTGYSSLNMISTLPIDALKLDMTFIRNAFKDGGDVRLIELIIDIADYLSVPVIAEGVETEAQLNTLKAMGCDLVQGYYFSKPVPPQDFEPFMLEKKRRLALPAEPTKAEGALDAWIERELHPEAGTMPGNIARALTNGFEVIYYVDAHTGHYVEFTGQGRYDALQIERRGTDFFGDTQRNIPRVIYDKDRPRVAQAMRKDTLLEQLTGNRAFSMTYRLVIDGKPVYYSLRAVRAEARDQKHIVIGVSNVHDYDAHRADPQAIAEASGGAFKAIAQALSSDFESIYYVDILTDAYTEYTAPASYEKLKIELSGTDFFGECRKNIARVVYSEDQARLVEAMDKQALLKALKAQPTVSIIYRLMIAGVPTHYRMKIVMTEDGQHIVIGVSNVSDQAGQVVSDMGGGQDKVAFAAIAQALAADYFSIYYVDIDTDRFIEYSADAEYEALGIEKDGDDFFNLSRTNIRRVVHPEDLDKVLSAFTKENLLKEMEKSGTFTLNYRLMFGTQVNYVAMKATRMADRNDHHIVIGVNNINAQMERQLAYDAARALSDTYSRIAQALAREYYSIYLVNTETDEFIEYSSSQDYKKLQVEQSGVDFFRDCRRNVLRLVYKEDLKKALAVWDKERLMPELEDGKAFSSTYRLMVGAQPMFINCKVLRMQDELDKKYIVVGISNVDEQMKREQEMIAFRDKANRDALTGAKSKHAYVDAVAEINTHMDMGSVQPFSVVVCDVNGLKAINDTLGHHAGDKLIQNASEIICQTFKHSPVFRVGGDEFVVIMHGQDHMQRAQLMAHIREQNRRSQADGGVVIACGMAEWQPMTDNRFEAVFDRADTAMYENKTALKAER